MKNNDFAIFILTHGRANNIITLNTLKKCNYTGKVYIVIDNEDSQQEQYLELYGDSVIIFDKSSIDGTFDIMDNFNGRNVVVFARNALNDIVKNLGIKYYMVLDDDYTYFRYRMNDKFDYPTKSPAVINSCFDNILDAMLEFFISTNCISIAFIQGGDLIGGKDNDMVNGYKPKRKVMNTFFFSTDRLYEFCGRINEDVNMYVLMGTRGALFLQIPFISVEQLTTQSNSGGLTDFYLETGTYYKSFYTVMLSPSSVTCRLMGNVDKRLHHQIRWKNTVPMIIREENKKQL